MAAMQWQIDRVMAMGVDIDKSEAEAFIAWIWLMGFGDTAKMSNEELLRHWIFYSDDEEYP